MMQMKIHPEIISALKHNKAVVALESTIITHGMPYPQNVEMAKTVEQIIRKHHAIPATIAIIQGVIHVGLDQAEIEYLAQAKDVIKVSKRDFGYVLSQKRDGATTVSGTMIAAEKAGIKVFATGGIGGVHREGQKTFDISRDLEELGAINVLVVCAGAKAILDLPLTMEFLETKGVEVLGYQTKELPAFYTRESGISVDYQMDSPMDVAKLMHAKWSMGIQGGILLTNPIPKAHSMNHLIINKAIDDALIHAKELGIKGKDTTPFLLSEIKDITGGNSLDANLELVYHNARVAAEIAVSYANLDIKK